MPYLALTSGAVDMIAAFKDALTTSDFPCASLADTLTELLLNFFRLRNIINTASFPHNCAGSLLSFLYEVISIALVPEEVRMHTRLRPGGAGKEDLIRR